MEEWMSGAIPYPLLLTSQVLILALLGTVCGQFARGQGWFTRPSRAIGRVLTWFGSVYLIVMIFRYIVRMSLYPEERWTGLSIPIFLHWVLALFVLTVARYHLQNSEPARRRLLFRFLGIAAVVAALVVWVGYLLAPAVLGKKLGFGPPKYAVKVDRSVGFKASDGVELVADVYRPRRAGRVPTILVRLSYSKTLVNRLAATLVGRMWAEHGYNVVIQGVRGRYESGGTFYPLVTERQDGIDTLLWLRKQLWFDGRLGMWGGSYFGYTQWVLADQVDPDRSAFLVQIASASFYDMLYTGGALSLESALYWAMMSDGPEDIPVASGDLERGFGRFPLVKTDDRASRDIGFFNDWVSHPKRDAYWRAVDGENRWATLKSPVLLMAGWFDPFLPSQLSDFVNIKTRASRETAAKSHLIIGPWTHASSPKLPDGHRPENYRLESLAPSIPWFDRYLKGDLDATEFPPVRIYVLGENVWRDELEWPLARTRYTPYYFDASQNPRSLVTKTPATSTTIQYRFDPQHPVPSRGGAMLGPRSGPWSQDLAPRQDVLAFLTPPFGKEQEFTGPVRAVLYVRSTAPSTDFTVTLMDVHPNGRAYKISEGILRRSYSPGSGPVRIEVSMWPTSILVGKGHALRVHVSSSSYPRFDVNPNTGGNIATETKTQVALQTLICGGASASHIVLPLIPR